MLSAGQTGLAHPSGVQLLILLLFGGTHAQGSTKTLQFEAREHPRPPMPCGDYQITAPCQHHDGQWASSVTKASDESSGFGLTRIRNGLK